MFRYGLYLIFGFAVIFASATAGAERNYYVQSIRAKVLAAPSFRAKVLGQASRGTKLQVVAKEGRWIKIKFYGKTGYVASLLVTPYPPLARRRLIRAEDHVFQKSVRRRASTYTSAAAARGLAQDDRRRIGGQEKTDYDALERVESFTVSDADLARFAEGVGQ